jgi:hypothetical protein
MRAPFSAYNCFGGINLTANLLCLREIPKGYPMTKPRKPKAKRAGANPVQKPAWYQALNDAGGKHSALSTKTGKKAKNKCA